MEEIPHCVIHRRRPVEYVCPACDNLLMCEECKLTHVNDERHAPENCKEVGLALMHQRAQDANARQTKELAKGTREGQKELEVELLQEMDRFRSSPAEIEEQCKMQRLVREKRYAELYFYTKSLPAVGANNETATEELNKRLLKVLDTTYEGLQKARNNVAAGAGAGAGETLAEKIAKMEEEQKRLTGNMQNSEEEQKRLTGNLQDSEEERKRLAETLQKSEESMRSCLTACDAIGFKDMPKDSTAEMDKQGLQKKKDIIKKLGDCLNAVENEFDSALAKFNAQLGTKAAEVREFKRFLDAKGEEVNERIAEGEKLLAEYKGHKAYAKVKKAYEDLVSNSSGDPVPRTVMLIYYYRSFTHPCGLDQINLGSSSVDDKGATIIACGLKLSAKVTYLRLCKETPARL